MILLDTHVVVWLYEGRRDLLSERAAALIEANDLAVSPLVRLELAYLREIGRLKVDPAEILDDLARRIGLGEVDAPLSRVVDQAASLAWTRDPFDRLIAAHALALRAPLLTADVRIRAHLPDAAW